MELTHFWKPQKIHIGFAPIAKPTQNHLKISWCNSNLTTSPCSPALPSWAACQPGHVRSDATGSRLWRGAAAPQHAWFKPERRGRHIFSLRQELARHHGRAGRRNQGQTKQPQRLGARQRERLAGRMCAGAQFEWLVPALSATPP